MGTVYLGRHQDAAGDELVAVKVAQWGLSVSAESRFETMGDFAAALKSSLASEPSQARLVIGRLRRLRFRASRWAVKRPATAFWPLIVLLPALVLVLFPREADPPTTNDPARESAPVIASLTAIEPRQAARQLHAEGVERLRLFDFAAARDLLQEAVTADPDAVLDRPLANGSEPSTSIKRFGSFSLIRPTTASTSRQHACSLPRRFGRKGSSTKRRR